MNIDAKILNKILATSLAFREQCFQAEVGGTTGFQHILSFKINLSLKNWTVRKETTSGTLKILGISFWSEDWGFNISLDIFVEAIKKIRRFLEDGGLRAVISEDNLPPQIKTFCYCGAYQMRMWTNRLYLALRTEWNVSYQSLWSLPHHSKSGYASHLLVSTFGGETALETLLLSAAVEFQGKLGKLTWLSVHKGKQNLPFLFPTLQPREGRHLVGRCGSGAWDGTSGAQRFQSFKSQLLLNSQSLHNWPTPPYEELAPLSLAPEPHHPILLEDPTETFPHHLPS